MAIVEILDLSHFESPLHRSCPVATRSFAKPKKYFVAICLL
jgi:hypothetical protein